MVNLQQFLSTVRLVYTKALKENICLLIVGGSIGRESYIEYWSDADLLLVLKRPNSRSLRLIKGCEEYIKKRFNIEVDTMITSKFTIERTSSEKLHGKIKNFLFFLPKEKILIQKKIKLPKINGQKFGYGFWATYAEQEKNFLRRNADIRVKDNGALRALAKKNIKIIFLILKQYLADSTSAPSTYEEVLSLGKMILPKRIIHYLRKYEDVRMNNRLSTMSARQLRDMVSDSVEIFHELGKFIINRINMPYEKRN